jgi:hypothetical protein
VAIRFISAPLIPVISASGTRVLVAMSPPGFLLASTWRHRPGIGCDSFGGFS